MYTEINGIILDRIKINMTNIRKIFIRIKNFFSLLF